MRTILCAAIALFGIPAIAAASGPTPEHLARLIEARGFKCPLNDVTPRLVALREMGDPSGTALTVYCRQQGAGICPTVNVYRVTRRAGGRVTVQRYIDPLSGKDVASGC